MSAKHSPILAEQECPVYQYCTGKEGEFVAGTRTVFTPRRSF